MATSVSSTVTDSQTAFNMLFSATPPRMTVVLDALVRRENRKMNRTVIRLPPKAAQETARPDNAPAAQQRVTPRPAPALTPMMPGEASLLASTFCSTAPDTAPAAREARVRGSLAYSRMLLLTLSPWPRKRDISCTGVKWTFPRHRLVTVIKRQTAMPPPSSSRLWFLLYIRGFLRPVLMLRPFLPPSGDLL